MAKPGSYRKILEIIETVALICGDKPIKTIKPIYEQCSGRSYPCQEHAGVHIILMNEDFIEHSCSSVAIGGIMYYYGIKNGHFTQYLDDECKQKIDLMKNPPNVSSGGCIIF